MMGKQDPSPHGADLANAVREACIRAAIEGYRDAAISGLCAEGAFEAAVSAMQMLDLDTLGASQPAWR